MNPDSKTELDQFYRETKYRVLPFKYDVLVGRHHVWLDLWMVENEVTSFTIMTAWNPQSQLASQTQNLRRNQHLLKAILKTSSIIMPVLGIGTNDKWSPEASWFIGNWSKEESLRVARSFDQNAIVFGFTNQKAQLLYTKLALSS